jgi:predicted ferric reductase
MVIVYEYVLLHTLHILQSCYFILHYIFVVNKCNVYGCIVFKYNIGYIIWDMKKYKYNLSLNEK